MSRLIIILFAALMAACSSTSDGDGRPVLAVSLEPQRAMLEQLAGDAFRIVTVMPNGDNPETFEPSVSTLRSVDQARAYFTVGSLPFEASIAKSCADTLRIVDTSNGIRPIYGTHSHRRSDGSVHAHSTADPHFWTSVRNARTIILTMAATLAEIDPANADTYRKRLAAYDAHLDSLDSALTKKLADIPSRSFMVWHPSLSYFARDYGLRQIAVGQDHKEGSAAALRAVIDNARTDSVAVFFFQREFDARQAETVNQAVGSRMVTINPTAYDWEAQLTAIADELARP